MDIKPVNPSIYPSPNPSGIKVAFNIDDSPAAKVRAEWKSLRRDLGNLICHIDGAVQGVTTIHEAREQGYKKGYEEGSSADKTARCADCRAREDSEKWSVEWRLFNDILTLDESDRELVRQFVKRLMKEDDAKDEKCCETCKYDNAIIYPCCICNIYSQYKPKKGENRD